ncbi:MAG: hypothetical protein ACJ71J_16105, partial [Nitrososphaeraceae archaeon]
KLRRANGPYYYACWNDTYGKNDKLKKKYNSTYPPSTYNTELLKNNDKAMTSSNSLISLE